MLCALACAGCSTLCSKYCRENPVVVAVGPVESCLKEPPPTPLPVSLIGPEAGCPAAFVGCLDLDGGLAMERNLRASRRWQAEAWTRCSVPDAGSKDGG